MSAIGVRTYLVAMEGKATSYPIETVRERGPSPSASRRGSTQTMLRDPQHWYAEGRAADHSTNVGLVYVNTFSLNDPLMPSVCGCWLALILDK
jgi:hypothetical protein